MKQTIHLYVTTRTDPVEDLDDIKSAKELKSWKQRVVKHALKMKDYSGLGGDIITDMGDYKIVECYAVVEYLPGQMHEADDKVGEPLLNFLRDNSNSLNWELEETGVSAVTAAETAEKHPYINPKTLWDNFTYGLIANPNLIKDEYEVHLEVVVKEK